MPIHFHDKDALITAAVAAGNPIAFLVGSPLSTKDGVGVPGVSQMLDIARDEIRTRVAARLSSFEEAIRGKYGGQAYQAAMLWLNGNLLQDGVNRVVEKAVRLARKSGSEPKFSCDGQACDWNLPPGTEQLAALVCRDRERFPGPILTTNFDPLLSLAIESCGAKPHLRVIQADGGLAQNVKRTGETDVVHLHGFWRDSDTLHSPAQLTAPRPRLKDSLKEILRQKTLIVAAYGGWDDVFATALAEVAVDDSAQVNVLWCFRDTNAADIERDYAKLFERVQPAITRGRFVTYSGIDCHSIFGEIAAALPPAPVASLAGAAAGGATIVGWQEINADLLSGLPELTKDDAVLYFDGAVPSLQHAVSDLIPRRESVGELTKRLQESRARNVPRSMQLIRAAGGEGKSTLLLQVAADLARTGDWAVLWRTSSKEGISPEQLSKLDLGRCWLVVADDADNIVPGLADSAYALSQSGRSGIHFLLAARDADWKSARGLQQSWAEWVTCHGDKVLRGITSADAKAVVTAWEKIGPDGLRELNSVADTAGRVAQFEVAVRDARAKSEEQQRKHRPQDGSFFGGLLAVRFGQNGLQAHVRTFLQRLKTVPIEGRNARLLDAILYVAACHGTDIPGIDERVLADLVGVPREWVQTRVVRPLGEEAAAVQSAGHVLTRHSGVAAAILVEAEQTLGVDLAEVWAHLVRQTVQTSKNGGVSYDTHSKILHAGPRLQKNLPPQFSEDRRKAIAIAAVNASVAAMPERLDCVVDLGKTYRHADEPEQAAQVFRDHLGSAAAKVDHNEVIRGYWYEWGLCEGLAGEHADHSAADAWLQGISISDELNPARLQNERGELEQPKLSCAGLGIAFGKLAQSGPGCPYAKARRAAAYLGRLTNPDTKAASYFNSHDHEADKLKTPHPRDVPEAITWLTAGVAQAGHDVTDPFLKALAKPNEVSFKHLSSKLPQRARPHSQQKQKTRQHEEAWKPSLGYLSLEEAFKPKKQPEESETNEVSQ